MSSTGQGRSAARSCNISQRLRSTAFAAAVLLFSCAKVSIADSAEALVSTAELKKLSVEELMDLEVTSVSKRPEKLADAASAIQVITAEDIREAGVVTLPESLRLADGLDVAQKNSHDWAISSRGFNTSLANKLLVLIDGRSVYTPLYSGVFWNAQDYLLADIDRIEVINGPGGTLWGANAVNGVINISSKSAKDTQGLYLDAGGGTQWQDFADARYGGVIAPDVYFRVYAKYFDDGREALANGKSAPDSWQQGRGGFRIDTQRTSPDNFTLQGDFYDSNQELPSGESKMQGSNLLGRWSHAQSDDSQLSLQTYIDQTHLALPAPALAFAPAGRVADDLDTFDVDFQHHFHANSRNQIDWGLGYRLTHDVVTNAPSLSFFPPTLQQNLYSGFVQDEFKLRDNLFVTLGTKLEHNDYTGLEVEPDARLRWTFSTNELLWAAISRAVRTPSRIDRDLAEPAPATGLTVLAGNPDFESETLLAYEIGYRRQWNSKLSTSLSTYYNEYDDVRSTRPSATPTFPGLPFPLTFSNALEGHTYGAELSANYQPREHWRLRAGYTFLHESLRIKPGEVDFNAALNETADPKQQFSIRSSLDLPHRVEWNASVRWVDALHLNNGPVTELVAAYLELDARLSWHPAPPIELSIVGQNLLHNHHPEYGFPDPSRVEIERSVFGTISWGF